MRHIAKQTEPKTLATTRCSHATSLSTAASARNAFNQVDKQVVRESLASEQHYLCAFCMRRIDPCARDAYGQASLKIAHRTPVDFDSTMALTWSNLLGSCDGGQLAGPDHRCCDAAQGSTALTVDPTQRPFINKLRYERRKHSRGLHITSDDPSLAKDVEDTLRLNAGDLPSNRESVWYAFLTVFKKAHPSVYGKPAWREFFEKWIAGYAKHPEYVGVIETKIR